MKHWMRNTAPLGSVTEAPLDPGQTVAVPTAETPDEVEEAGGATLLATCEGVPAAAEADD